MKNAEVLVKFVGNTEDLTKKTQEASQIVKGFGKGVGNVMKSIGTLSLATSGLIVATALKGIKNIVESSVEAYSTFEQLEGGLISLFGEGSREMNQILKDSENAYRNLTMSQNDYLTAFQTSYPLVNAGLSANADAIEYTNKMLQLSSDLFNTYGGSIEYYQTAINWALKGSFVYLDNLNLGIKGTQEGFIKAANESGILGRNIESVSELTNDEIIDVIQHYAEAYGVWGKTSAEATETILGSMNMVKATWNNFILGLSKKGDDLNKLIDNLVNSALAFLDNILPVIQRALEGIAKALPTIAQTIGDMLPGLLESLLPPLLEAILGLLDSLITNLPSIIKTLMDAVLQALNGVLDLVPSLIDMVLDGALVILNALADALPDLIPKIIEVLLESLFKILEHIDEITEVAFKLVEGLITGLLQALPVISGKLPELIKIIIEQLINMIPQITILSIQLLIAIVQGIIQALPEIFIALFEAMDELIAGGTEEIDLTEPINNITNWFAEIPQKIVDFFASLPEKIGYALGFVIGKLIQFGIDAVNWVITEVPKIINNIITFFAELPGNIWNWLVQTINNIIKWGIDMIQKGKQAMTDFVNNLIDTIKNLPNKMLEIGRNIVEGIWNGIKNAKDWVIDKVKGFAKGIINGMKDALGIHSPSTEFALLGRFSVLGYTDALDDMKKQVQTTIDSVFGIQPEINGSMNSTYSPQMNVIVQNNMELDPLGQVVSQIKTFSGGAKNDYNWGATL